MSKLLLIAAAMAAAQALTTVASADDHVWGHVEFSKARADGPLLLTITKALTNSPEYEEEGVLLNRKDDVTLWLGIYVPYPAKAQQAWLKYAGVDRLYCSYDPAQPIPSVQSVAKGVAYKATQCLAEGANLKLFLLIDGWGFD